MSTEIAVRNEVVDPPSLDDLPDLIRSEVSAAQFSMRATIEHIITAGEYLAMAKSMVPTRGWYAWLNENLQEVTAAALYIRIAKHQDEVRELGISTLRGAQVALRGKNASSRTFDYDEALRLKKLGWGDTAVARYFGVTKSAVRYATGRKPQDSKHREYQRQHHQARNDAKRLRAREQISKSVRAHGGSTAEGYSYIRKALQALDNAYNEAEGESKKSLNSAITSLYNAEDRIGHAIRGEYHPNHATRYGRVHELGL